MTDQPQTALISGAGIAGLVLGWWLRRSGVKPTIVELAPEIRKGGHPVDLWGSAVEVVDRMGLLPELQAAGTHNDRGVMITPGRPPLHMDLRRLEIGFADRHLEIMRGELVNALYRAVAGDVEFMFGNSISKLEEREDKVQVEFTSGTDREFSFVVGADGQHSNTRHLAFGKEAEFTNYIGGYICGYTIPNTMGLKNAIHRYVVPDKTVAVFPIRQSNELGVGFLFRSRDPINLHHRDTDGHKRLVRDRFKEDEWLVPQLLAGMDGAQDFYFEPFSQILMGGWVKSRIALVGDAGFGPSPAVGGGTSLAVVSAYMLARQIANAADDPAHALTAYERDVLPIVEKSRQIGPVLVKSLIPTSRLSIALSFLSAPILMALPRAIRGRLPLLPGKAVVGMRAIAEAPLDPPHVRE
ncbi:FAD-binding monooxygenase [Nitratireductor aestuarii]|uniref:FAD-binding monooxygenase n=1 Tax=Nitratireductor aestuarii TaxID=1735103 RepID=A0A916RER1_9HYPH|nr:FAD-dependent monooxygenase [Nitratireductor aestuarii]GGA51292.1 FAD-binding monooxygenase [Nitratireductor aestuarii]